MYCQWYSLCWGGVSRLSTSPRYGRRDAKRGSSKDTRGPPDDAVLTSSASRRQQEKGTEHRSRLGLAAEQLKYMFWDQSL